MNALDRRRFLGRAGAGALGLWAGAVAPSEGAVAETVGDHLWLWCHAAGAHTRTPEQYGIPDQSHIPSHDAAAYMGLRNVLMVRHGADLLPPTPECAQTVAQMDRAVWSVEGGGGGDVEGVLALRKNLPNLRGVILDDYFGRVPRQAMWLAENNVRFPVSLTFRFAEPQPIEKLELVQSGWIKGDYLSKEIALDVRREGGDWTELTQLSLPAVAGAGLSHALDRAPLTAVRLRILSTHDTDQAMSCGLTRVRLFANGSEVPRAKIEVEAGSTYPGHPATNVLADGPDPNDPFSLESLRRFRERLRAGERPLDIWVVLYTGEFALPILKPHLDLCEVVTMWTWTAAELPSLEASFERFETLIGPKRKVLGCYMWDYGARQPMPVEAMQRQCELGLKWLRARRIEGMIFLASCLCDLKLEAVEWTRQWIARHGPERL